MAYMLTFSPLQPWSSIWAYSSPVWRAKPNRNRTTNHFTKAYRRDRLTCHPSVCLGGQSPSESYFKYRLPPKHHRGGRIRNANTLPHWPLPGQILPQKPLTAQTFLPLIFCRSIAFPTWPHWWPPKYYRRGRLLPKRYRNLSLNNGFHSSPNVTANVSLNNGFHSKNRDRVYPYRYFYFSFFYFYFINIFSFEVVWMTSTGGTQAGRQV